MRILFHRLDGTIEEYEADPVSPPPIPRRARRDTLPYTDAHRVELRAACLPPHPRLVRR